ncbi:hypothetical protein PV10_02335 [Exophiala mesophila]|uniref:Kelch repeat-containing protein n=1 Tax=Exophiala mesophila TaxID=212818 RepID=A0A0D1ZJ25_EXOME|nr:uncharacterized protein PV10_02335 [Exophiala mesophila]KIV94582.1 hypothetical protein PV10_02335 [Exophiala mesophila]
MRSLIPILLLIVWSLSLRPAAAVDVQQNVTICNWARLRAGVIRDAVYLDGGLLWWQTAFADGTTPVVSSDGNVAGDMFMLNFSTPFNTASTNLSALLQRMPKAGGAGNNIAPNYVDGTMFTNDGELYLYGGLPRLTDATSPQSAQAVLGYEAYQYGPDRPSWAPGFYQGTLPDDVTRYVTNGAGVSAPSEDLGFYFSGMRAPGWGPIYYDDSSANVTANTLIQVDMSTMRNEEWTNITIPDNIPARANAELVWVPASERGILVAIGGVIEPEEIWARGLNESQQEESRAQSPGFMTSVPVYDIASQEWYLQNTTGEAPGQLTQFCSVLATAQDSSSHNIYIYGGYNGLDSGNVPSDDVWILSLPSFTWVNAYKGTSTHGRSGHRCVTPYPDQMFVIGGVHQNQANCVEGGIIQVFNLNTLEFQDSYDPDVWSNYEVPAALREVIGGNRDGGSTATTSWSEDALETLFTSRYSKQVTQYYPYSSVSASASNAEDESSSGGVGRAAIIGISVAAGIVGLLIIILCLLLLRRRRIIRSGSSVKSSTSGHSRVTNWLNGGSFISSKTRSPVSPMDPDQMEKKVTDSSESTPPLQPQRHEMAGTERPKPPYEMATAYNDLDHPRHSSILDGAYDSKYGHTHAHSNSKSTSSNEYRPSPLSGTQFANPQNEEEFSFSRSSYGPGQDTVNWPFPSVGAAPYNGEKRTRFENDNSPASSSIHPIVEESNQIHELGAERGTARGSTGFATMHPNDSASSGFDTLPSPRPDGPLTGPDDRRQSLFHAGVSPVTPTSQHRYSSHLT